MRLIYLVQGCINGELVRPTPPRDDSPSTACQASTVCASGGVRLGKANPPCFGAPPGIEFHPKEYHHLHPLQSLDRAAVPLRSANPVIIQCSGGHLSIHGPRPQEEEVHLMSSRSRGGSGSGAGDPSGSNPSGNRHTQEEEEQVPIAQEEESRQEEVHLVAIQAMAVHIPPPQPPPGSTPPQPDRRSRSTRRQSNPHLHLQQHLQGIEQLIHGHR